MIKNASKRAVNNGKRKKAGASHVLFSLPIVPRGLSFFPLPSFPSTQGGLGGRGGGGERKDPKNENAGSGVASKILGRD